MIHGNFKVNYTPYYLYFKAKYYVNNLCSHVFYNVTDAVTSTAESTGNSGIGNHTHLKHQDNI